MRRFLLIICTLFFFAVPAWCTHTCSTCYISAAGSDANDGTSKTFVSGTTGPWLHAPGMPSATGNASTQVPVAGDSYIFRGGDTWHFHTGTPGTGGSWAWTWGGTTTTCQLNPSAGAVVKTTCIYIGTDHTYFSGASFARPLFSQDDAISTTRPATCSFDATSFNAVNLGSNNFLIFDDIEMSGVCWQGGSNSGWVTASGTQVELSNLYIHGWVMGTTTGVDDTYSGLNGGMPKGNYILCDHNVFDNTDGTLGNTTASGFAIRNTCKEISYSFFNRVSNGCICNPSSVHDNTLQFLFEPVTTQHGNIIETNTGVAATGTIYAWNNLVHDFTVNGWWLEPVQANEYWFNNINYNDNGLGGCFLIDGQGTTGTSINFFSNNNTWDSSCQIRFYAAHAGSEFKGTATFGNDHFIGFQTATCTGVCATPLLLTYNVDAGASMTPTNNGGHVFQSLATANTQGYTTGNNFAPSTGSATIGAGASLASFCSGIGDSQAAAACTSGTSAGVKEIAGEGGMIVSAPAVATNARGSTWDSGAYQFAAAPIPPGGSAQNGVKFSNGAILR